MNSGFAYDTTAFIRQNSGRLIVFANSTDAIARSTN